MKTPATTRGRVKLVPLMMATFFMVSGGPFGLEELFSKAGYAASFVILLVTPVLWSLPTSLMVAELSTAMPEDGGFYVWVRRAMGPFWGFQESWLSLAASVFDMAIYPTLFVSYLARLWPWAGGAHAGVLLSMAMITVCAMWNLRGSVSVGNGSRWLAALLLSPFVVVAGIAFLHPAAQATQVSAHSGDLLGGILIAMWNYMGWDNAANIAGEVESPQSTYPRMIAGAMTLVVGIYVVCLAAMAHAGIPVASWTTGGWADTSGVIAGPWAEFAVAISGMICGLGMFNALTMTYARLPYAMAKDGLLPAIFAFETPRSGTPWVAVITCAACWMLSLGLSFSRLVMLDILLYGLSLLLEFAALVVLRIREPRMPRPYRVPGGTVGAVLLGVPPMALIVLAAVRDHSERLGPVSAFALGAGVIALGPLLYWIMTRRGVAFSAQSAPDEEAS